MSGAAALEDFNADQEAPLLLECARGSGSAWRSLHRHYYPVTVAFLRKFGVHELEVEDAAQDVFLQIHRYLPRFRGSSELKTWLYRLCITQARAARRRRRISETLARWLPMFPEDAVVHGSDLCEATARRRVAAALDRLSEPERCALVLYEMEGLPGKEVAEILKCKEATLWRRLHYARKRFSDAINELAVNEGPS
ncbi:MAG TPA: RNA polymerase sigma factor [Polyangiaceae bacterium]|nr:RNA polymerase sigma factor [Polyangiaceae bacterium]